MYEFWLSVLASLTDWATSAAWTVVTIAQTKIVELTVII